MSKQSRAKKIHSFFDSKKKIKIHNENTSKRTESNKTKVIKKKKKKKLMKIYQQVRKIKIR